MNFSFVPLTAGFTGTIGFMAPEVLNCSQVAAV